MIVTEHYATRKDGVELLRTYSDEGHYIERDGVKYAEAVDVAGAERVYTETEELVEKKEDSDQNTKNQRGKRLNQD